MQKVHPKRNVYVDTPNIMYHFECPKCKTPVKVQLDVLLHVGNPLCSYCENELDVSIGVPKLEVTPAKVMSELNDLVLDNVKNYKQDWIRDEGRLNNYGGKFLWGCRENGTDLICMPKDNSDIGADYLIWITGTDDKRSNIIKYYDGVHLMTVTVQQAKEVWLAYLK